MGITRGVAHARLDAAQERSVKLVFGVENQRRGADLFVRALLAAALSGVPALEVEVFSILCVRCRQ
jgi:hypothetical protein